MASLAEKSDMIDPHDTVLSTFSHYAMKGSISFLKTTIDENSRLVGRKVKDLDMTFDFIIAKIKRGTTSIVPRGDVELEAGDIIVFGGEEYFDPLGQQLIEFSVPKDHPWANKKIVDLNLPANQLILSIQRGEHVVSAEGNTVILENDRITLSTEDKLDFNAS